MEKAEEEAVFARLSRAFVHRLADASLSNGRERKYQTMRLCEKSARQLFIPSVSVVVVVVVVEVKVKAAGVVI